MTRILIVDDNDLNLKMAQDLLHMAGFETLAAKDAETGMQVAETEQPDLILMDMYLPIKDGYQASQELKENPRTQHIPIVAFTALAMDQERRRAKDAGCSGFISKPINVELFAKDIVQLLKTYQVEAQVFTGQEATGPPKPDKTRAEREIEEFFMVVSHDLQAPLRKVEQFTGMLKDTTSSRLSPEDQEILSRIEHSAQQMHDIVSDMISLTHIEHTQTPFQPVNLSEVIEEVLQDNQALIDQLQAQVQVDASPVGLNADPEQVRQLLNALIENSLKFHQPDTPPVVALHSEVVDSTCEIRVEDNGIGFTEEQMDKIFMPFVKLQGHSKGNDGRGMGLSIARKIAQRHGGDIRVSSTPGKGSVFTVALPVQAR